MATASSSTYEKRWVRQGLSSIEANIKLRAHSPLKLAELRENLRKPSKHLLAHLYYLIVNNQGLKDEEDDEDNEGISTCALSLDLENTVINPFQSVTNYILKGGEEEKAKIEKIQIPSALELSKKFNVDFKPTHRGIRGIKFQSAEQGGGETNTLYLPEIKLESDSEVVLRNLVAYEAALFAAHSPGSKLELTDFVDLMCRIVDTTEDVKLLRNNDIIEEGGLSDEKIAKMFNGINRSAAARGEQSEEEKSESQKAVEEVKKMVEEWERKMMWTRARKESQTTNVIATSLMSVI
nr:putative UPF0481 protein At3g02645 [Ipomoea batatas]